jgi:hypothetical protein
MQREMFRRRRFLASLFLLFTRAHAPDRNRSSKKCEIDPIRDYFPGDVDLGAGKR